MKKGGTQIEKDVFDIFKDEIKRFIKGDVYLQGTRPHNSNKEDCVIGYLTVSIMMYNKAKLTLTSMYLKSI